MPRMLAMHAVSFLRLALLIGLAGVLPWSAQAARPFMTDDARITTAGSCQLESWSRRYKDRRENWALPACNPTGNFEITAGGGNFSGAVPSDGRDAVLQGKTLFRPLQTNDWGWGVALGRIEHGADLPGPNRLGNTYLYLPLSVSTQDDRVVWHTNLGWMRDRESQRNATTWGAGVEYWANERVMLIAESFGDDRQRPFVQTGLRLSLVPGLLQIDATRGQQTGGPVRNSWISFGLRYTPDKLF